VVGVGGGGGGGKRGLKKKGSEGVNKRKEVGGKTSKRKAGRLTGKKWEPTNEGA